jgi:hypothetical protein
MKKLLILTSLLISGGLWADMDKSCKIDWLETEDFSTVNFLHVYIDKQCERNNILEIWAMPHYQTAGVISGYCRFDRQIVITNTSLDSEEYNDLSCVLYDNETRERIKIKRQPIR